ncbi:hypothetical protein [Sphingobacterium sp. IITKGP-BTPF85]|uniref:hypothetical protein n=1 Tax=Sphingobacterium sp. IITKGP-BTPF85 TaxID=1338009 RepID=UPI0004278013|nr:hypothetical protein [Sphingobacterium sp. IITKGP-BTPF85]
MSEQFDKEKQEYINALQKDYRYSISKFDTQSLTIAGGALGIALTFIKDIAPLKQSIFNGLFYLSLIAFVITIMLGFIAHYYSGKILLKTIKLAEEDKLHEFKEDKFIPIYNFSVLIFLTLGLVSLITYCILNIEKVKKSEIKVAEVIEGKHIPDTVSKKNSNVKNFIYTDSVNNKTIKLK